MKIIFHKAFDKKYKKLRLSDKKKFKERRNIFLKTPFHSILNNYPLRGKHLGYRSIDITGNLRVVYRLLSENIAVFVDINTHPNLYN